MNLANLSQIGHSPNNLKTYIFFFNPFTDSSITKKLKLFITEGEILRLGFIFQKCLKWTMNNVHLSNWKNTYFPGFASLQTRKVAMYFLSSTQINIAIHSGLFNDKILITYMQLTIWWLCCEVFIMSFSGPKFRYK